MEIKTEKFNAYLHRTEIIVDKVRTLKQTHHSLDDLIAFRFEFDGIADQDYEDPKFRKPRNEQVK